MLLQIPKPTGHFGVGKTICSMSDTSRQEKHGAQGNRELVVYIYYPTQVAHESPYAPDIAPILKANLAQSLNVPLEKMAYLDAYKEHTQINAPLDPADEKYPLLFFSPGLTDPVELYTSLLEEMASHGYVVCAINHTFGVDPTVFPDGRVARIAAELSGFWHGKNGSFEDIADGEHELRVQDAHFVIDRFKNIGSDDPYAFLQHRLEYDAMGMFGHSLGGSVALQICRERSDVKACADLDGVVFGSASKRYELFSAPTMFVMSGQQITDEELKKYHLSRDRYDNFVLNRIPHTLFEQLKNDAFYITVLDARHNSFSDLPLLKSPFESTDYEPVQIGKTTRACLVEFFDTYLRDERLNMELLGSLPNVMIETNLP